MCCSVLQCVAVCCSVLQCIVTYMPVWPSVARARFHFLSVYLFVSPQYPATPLAPSLLVSRSPAPFFSPSSSSPLCMSISSILYLVALLFLSLSFLSLFRRLSLTHSLLFSHACLSVPPARAETNGGLSAIMPLGSFFYMFVVLLLIHIQVSFASILVSFTREVYQIGSTNTCSVVGMLSYGGGSPNGARICMTDPGNSARDKCVHAEETRQRRVHVRSLQEPLAGGVPRLRPKSSSLPAGRCRVPLGQVVV